MNLMKAKESQPESPTKPSIEECFRVEETPLLRFAFGLVKRREVAEEMVQEAFMRAHQHWLEIEQPRAWLYRAVRNLSLNYLRKHQREELTEDDDIDRSKSHPDEQTRRIETATQLRMVLAEMPEEDQQLIRLKYDENLSYASISEKLGLGVGNVGYRLHHLLKTLGDALKRAGVEGSEG